MLLRLLYAALIAAGVHGAQFTMTASQFVSVKVGTAFELTWTNASGSVTLLLKMVLLMRSPLLRLLLVRGLTGTSYTWTLESSLVSGSYAFEIDDSSGPNYSVQFTLAEASASSSSASTSSSSSLTKYCVLEYPLINVLNEYIESIPHDIFNNVHYVVYIVYVVLDYILGIPDFVAEVRYELADILQICIIYIIYTFEFEPNSFSYTFRA
ncbi:uncharacterized protein PAC_13261 [Phialocephala subalpina]|uniref:Yeast cell wall synthesis Kre9/Knh1-like N-terminal domain-containing protein n=1 Tax=Phialocephala subalpina TaxID=576137 RepID=A0A1L7XEB1_9HELO|nr:uncharacterized protein PAC_13261 [Phialocephala subalpina]